MRTALLAVIFATLAAAAPTPPPIIFVHGNGDDASKWMTVIWRFESNGYPRDRLFAARFIDPVARTLDDTPLIHRSSTIDQASQLSAEVARVLILTGAPKVILVGSSRGGLTIRNYLKNAGGAAVVSHAILCGAPNHGVMALDQMTGNEFNGRGKFLSALNAGVEVVPGVQFLTIRSDHNDKYAQPNGRAAGLPVKETGVTFEGPTLKGAEDAVLPGLDHREIAFDARAFAVMYRFITGKDPATVELIPEAQPIIGGVITSFVEGVPTNSPAPGIHLRVFALRAGSALRDGVAVYDQTTGETGVWGPLTVDPTRNYEFELASGAATVRYFRSPFARSSVYVNLRFRPIPATAAASEPTILVMRPQGYLSKGRDPVMIDGKEYDGLPAGVPTVDEFKLKTTGESVAISLRGEQVYAQAATAKTGEICIAEFNRE